MQEQQDVVARRVPARTGDRSGRAGSPERPRLRFPVSPLRVGHGPAAGETRADVFGSPRPASATCTSPSLAAFERRRARTGAQPRRGPHGPARGAVGRGGGRRRAGLGARRPAVRGLLEVSQDRTATYATPRVRRRNLSGRSLPRGEAAVASLLAALESLRHVASLQPAVLHAIGGAFGGSPTLVDAAPPPPPTTWCGFA